jgi:hypothetical protein
MRGTVDVATLQTLARREDIADITAGYGLVVVDECHHIPAAAFENVGTRPRFVHYSKRSRGDSTRRPAARSTY